MADELLETEGVFDAPIRFNIPIDMTAAYADYTIVQRDDEHFTLIFFDVRRPFAVGTDEQKREQLKAIDHVDAVAIARVALTPDHLDRLIKALQSQQEKFARDRAAEAKNEH